MQKIRKLFEAVNGVRGVSVTFTEEQVEVVVFVECSKLNQDRMLELLYAENGIRKEFPEIKFSFKRFWIGGEGENASSSEVR